MSLQFSFLRVLTLSVALAGLCANAQTGQLTNPLLPSGPDPWVITNNGYYYFMGTTGTNLTIWKTRHLADLKTAEKKVVWTPPAAGPYSHDIWAPELHRLQNAWYIYFSADAGTNSSHRVWVLENTSADPLSDHWTLKGKLSDATDQWAIDGSVAEIGHQLYFVWSGWEAQANGVQSIYIARLKNPWTVEGPRVRISTPDFPWERIGDIPRTRDLETNPAANPSQPLHVDVNEGPEILQHGGKVFVVYSAGGCWTDFYQLGLLSANLSANLVDAASWTKSTAPIFWESPKAHAFGTGHNGFFKSMDGKQDWIIYHANPETNQGCGGNRSPRAQPFTWNPDGTPNFGRPVPTGVTISAPSGEVK